MTMTEGRPHSEIGSASWSPETEQESPHAETRAELMDRLDYKVEAVLALRQRIDRLDRDADPEVVNQELDRSWAEVETVFPPTTLGRFRRLHEVRERERVLNLANDRVIDTVLDEATEARLAERRDELQQLATEEQALLDDDDVRYLVNVDAVIGGLRQKNAVITGLRRDPVQALAEVNDHFPEHKLQLKDIARLVYSPFELTAVIKSGAYSRVLERGSYGTHFVRSPISVVRERDDVEDTIRHESVHNLLDSAMNLGRFRIERFEQLHDHLKRSRPPEERRAIAASLLDLRPENLVDQMQNELLAHLERWEQEPWNQPRPKMRFLDPHAAKSFDFHADHLSTAGSDAADIADILESIALASPDTEVGKRILGIRADFRDRFVQSVEHLRRALITARTIGEEAVERLHALLFVVPPSRYRHLERYLDAQYGKPPQTAA